MARPIHHTGIHTGAIDSYFPLLIYYIDPTLRVNFTLPVSSFYCLVSFFTALIYAFAFAKHPYLARFVVPPLGAARQTTQPNVIARVVTKSLVRLKLLQLHYTSTSCVAQQ